MIRKSFALFALASAFVMSMSTQAASTRVENATVLKVTVITDRDESGEAAFGGCALQLSESPPGCPNAGWVAVDCQSRSGLSTRAEADSLYQTALAAKVTEIPVMVQVNNSVRLNGMCVTERIRLE
jgi:hypothetical protein